MLRKVSTIRPISFGEVIHHRGNYLVRRFGLLPGEVSPWHRDPRLEPGDRIHRAANTGKEIYEEVTTFFLDQPDAVSQPEVE